MNSKSSEKLYELYSQEDLSPFIKVHRARWVVLIIFVIVTTISTFQWFQYSSISEVMKYYYNVSATEVDWTANVFMIVWPILVFPTSFLIEKQGLRVAVLVGCTATAVGAVIKVFSVDTNLFYLVMIGQVISSISQPFLLSLPPKIAATWFPPNEMSVACSIGVFGMLLGSALGHLIPPNVVKDGLKVEEIASELYALSSGVAATSLLVTFIVFLYFPKQPNHAPSRAQLEERVGGQNVTISLFLSTLKTLVTSKPYLIHTMAYGICLAIFYSTETLLNQYTKGYFKDMDMEHSHKIHLIGVIVALLSPILTGLILDKTGKYKRTALVTYLLCILSMGGILAFQFKRKWLVLLATGSLSFFTNAYIVAGIEFSLELTHPTLQSISTGILITTAQILGILSTLFLTMLNSNFGSIWALSVQLILLLIGALLTYWIPNNLIREEFLWENEFFEKVPQIG